ncbi:DUF397 domain-containing protein [Streptomyces sp. NPDC018059]|uniref:DUF397 domain-containing protein n=1 Tax=Streptomyces sp. NPDC018059 TaxID=3365041 RepID=UPI0037B2F55C
MIREAAAGPGSELHWFKSSYSSSSDPNDCVEVALDWRKSSYSDSSNGEDCVEIAQAWHKSSHSSSGDGNDCVEVAALTPHTIHIRDSKTPTAPHLTVTPATWSRFLADVRPTAH